MDVVESTLCRVETLFLHHVAVDLPWLLVVTSVVLPWCYVVMSFPGHGFAVVLPWCYVVIHSWSCFAVCFHCILQCLREYVHLSGVMMLGSTSSLPSSNCHLSPTLDTRAENKKCTIFCRHFIGYHITKNSSSYFNYILCKILSVSNVLTFCHQFAVHKNFIQIKHIGKSATLVISQSHIKHNLWF